MSLTLLIRNGESRSSNLGQGEAVRSILVDVLGAEAGLGLSAAVTKS